MKEQAKLEVILTLRDEMTQKLNNTINASQKMAKGFMVAGAAAGAVIGKFTMTAARTETLGIAMDAVARSTNTSTELLREQEAALKKQGIATQEARTILTRFMQSELDVADASKIARVAQDLAVIAGQNSSEAAETLTQAIATGSAELLRQYGITKTMVTIYEEYGATIGKDADELTNLEKKQAFVNTIMAEGGKVAGVYEDAMNTAGKKIGSLDRHIQEAQTTIGNYFLPYLNMAVDALTNFLKAINTENIEKFFNIMKENKEALIIVAGAIAGPLVFAFIAWAASATAAAISTIAAMAPLILLGALVGLLVVAWMKDWGGMQEKVRVFSEAISNFWNNVIKPTFEMIQAKAKEVFTSFMIFYNEYVIPMWEVWKKKMTEALNAWKSNWDSIKAIFEGAWQVMKGILQVAWSVISGIVKVGMAVFQGDWKKAWEAIKESFSTVWKGIYNIGAGIFRMIISAMASMVNGAITLINKLIGAINKIPGVDIGEIGKLKTSDLLNQIPTLAVGTNYIPQDTLAFLHKGEAVVPKQYNPSAGGGGITINITGNNVFNNESDMDLLVEKVRNVLSREQEKAQWGIG